MRLSVRMYHQLTVGAVLAVMTACGGEKSDEAAASSGTGSVTGSEEGVVRPGALLVQLDTAMGSIAFQGQAASLRLSSWSDQHCDIESTVKEGYRNDSSIFWGCNLSTITLGPDTPRGGLNRVKQVSCSIDKATAAGTFAIDGDAHTFNAVIDTECWGADFAEMAAEHLPEQVNADGFAEVELTVTGYKEVPTTWTDEVGDWSIAYDIVFGFSANEKKNYRMLLYSGDDGGAASIAESENGEEARGLFAMSIRKSEASDDEHEFRYEGRFGYGTFGDGQYGSRHVRVLVSGAYEGTGGFSSITAGRGYEAGMYGDQSGVVTGGNLQTFVASSAGLGALDFGVDTTGAPVGTSSPSGVAGINNFNYTGSASEKKSFLTESVAAYTSASDWHKANGPLKFTSVAVGD